MTTSYSDEPTRELELRSLLNFNKAVDPLFKILWYTLINGVILCVLFEAWFYISRNPALGFTLHSYLDLIAAWLGISYSIYIISWPWDVYFATRGVKHRARDCMKVVGTDLSKELAIMGYLQLGAFIIALGLHLLGIFTAYKLHYYRPDFVTLSLLVVLTSSLIVRPLSGYLQALFAWLRKLVREVEQAIHQAISKVEAASRN